MQNDAMHKKIATQRASRTNDLIPMQQQQPTLSDLVSSARAQIAAALSLLQSQVTPIIT